MVALHTSDRSVAAAETDRSGLVVSGRAVTTTASGNLLAAASLPLTKSGMLEKALADPVVVDEASLFGVLRLFTLEDTPNLLRGSRLSAVMRNHAESFDFGPTLDAFSHSEGMDGVDYFISHNWSVPRTLKFSCLAFHFNFDGLRLVMVCAAMLSVSLAAASVIMPEDCVAPEDCQWARMVMTFLPMPLVGLALSFLQDLIYYCGCWFGPSMFLDKTCVNQVDGELQRKAISKIGAIIAHSDRMVVIYSDEYLTKLWTVYEVCCFLTLRSAENLVIIPLDLPKAVFRIVVLMAAGRMLLTAAELVADMVFWQFLSYALALLGMFTIFRRHMRKRAELFARLSSFDVRECICTSPADRPMIYSNIAVLMHGAELVSEGTSEDEALTAFSNLVQTELPELLALNSGWNALTYARALTLALLSFPDFLLEIVAWQSLSHVLWVLVLVGAIVPVTLRLMVFLAGVPVSLRLHGWRDSLFVFLGTIVTTSLSLVLFGLTRLALIADDAVGGEATPIAIIVVCSVSVAAILLSFVPFQIWNLCNRRNSLSAANSTDVAV